MTELAFILVIVSAVAHGLWNFLFKQADDKDAFLGLSKIVEPILYIIPFLYVLYHFGLSKSALGYVAVGALLSVANYLLLANAYKRLDLALAYPISRSSTIFLPFLAYIFLGEVIDATGWASVIVVSTGVVVIQFTGGGARPTGNTPQVKEWWGLCSAILAALTVALYTLWGRAAIEHMHPFLYMYCYTLVTCLYFVPALKKLNKGAIVHEWRVNKWRIAAVAFLNTFSYVLMLYALSMSKVAYVGALRQLSLVFGVALGSLILQEKLTGYRIIGLLLIIMGAALSYFAG